VTEGILRDTAYTGHRPAAAVLRPARQAAGHLAMLRLVPYLRARRSELSLQAWFRLLVLWRALCGTLPLYDYVVRPAGLLFAVAGGLLLRSTRALDGFLDDRAALLRAQRRAVPRAVTALAFLMAVVLLLSFTLFGTGLEVFIDGESIGFVGSEAEFDAALREVETRVTEILGRPFSVAPDIRYRFGTVNRHRIFDHDQVVNQLFGQISDVRRLFALSIDGVVVAAVENPADIEMTLEMVTEAFLPPVAVLDSGFAESVLIDRRWVDANLLTTASGLESLLLGQRRAAQVTTLAAGESIAAVAARSGLSEQGLLDLNNVEAIEAGQTIYLSGAVTLLSVIATTQRVVNQEIDFDIDFEDDPTMYRGDTRVLIPGVAGRQRVIEEVTYRNGMEVSTAVIDAQVMEEPVTELYAIGTRTRPTTAPYGTFIRPLAPNARGVSMVSGFGMRTFQGVRENHTGVDWSAPRNTAIRAADGGKVITVGNLGNRSYGRYVVIDHGVNTRGQRVTTLYAHCNTILVREGDTVARGETIAMVGSTGRSTGNHLHFEVRLNGTPVNPFNNTHSNVPR